MKSYVLAVVLFAATAVVFAVAGVSTQVACGNCNKASQANDETPPTSPSCSITLDCHQS
jgi:hypothetical protein